MASQAERDALIAASAGGDQQIRDALLVDIHAWLEKIDAAGGVGGGCVLAQQGATINADADIKITSTPAP